MAHYLVTGGAGFVGSHIAIKLIDIGHDVTVLDNLSTGNISNLNSKIHSIRFIEDDIRNSAILKKLLLDIDFVLHQAAIPSVPRSIQDPLITNSSNIDGTLTLLVAAKEAKVKRFVFASSSSIYGYNPVNPKNESQIPQPQSPYALTKMTCEYYCRMFFDIYGLETVCLRYFNVFGPRQSPHSQYSAVIPAFIHALMHGKSPVIYSDGQQSRDFTFVDNISEANIKASTAPQAAGKVFNIGCGKQTTINQLFNNIQQLLGTNNAPKFLPKRPGDVEHSTADISRAMKHLNYQIGTTLDEGLKLTVDYFRKMSG